MFHQIDPTLLVVLCMLLASVAIAFIGWVLSVNFDRQSRPPQIPDRIKIEFGIDTDSFMTWFNPDHPKLKEYLKNFIEFLKKSKGII